MSFEAFMQKKEQASQANDAAFDKIYNSLLPDFVEKMTQYYTEIVDDMYSLDARALYDKYAQNTDVYNFITKYKNKDRVHAMQRVAAKVDQDSSYAKSAFRTRLQKRLDQETPSSIVSVQIKENRMINPDSVRVTFLMQNDDQIVLDDIQMKSYRNDKGKLFLTNL